MMVSMSAYPADRVFSIVLSDEAWQAPLSETSIQAVIAQLEAQIPPDAQLDEARLARLRRALRTLAENVEALRAGRLDEAAVVRAWLSVFEA